jgi:hypothetical protein
VRPAKFAHGAPSASGDRQGAGPELGRIIQKSDLSEQTICFLAAQARAGCGAGAPGIQEDSALFLAGGHALSLNQ